MTRRILAGRLILAGVLVILLVLLAYWISLRFSPPKLIVSIPTPNPALEEKLKQTFNIEVPESADKISLSPAPGVEGEGLATREKKDGQYAYTILANLAEPPAGSFYQGWLIRGKAGEADYSVVSFGKLREAKGGWLGELTREISDLNQVMVTRETRANPSKPGETILTGSF